MPHLRTLGVQVFLDGGSVDSQLPLDRSKRHPLGLGFLNRFPFLPLKERRLVGGGDAKGGGKLGRWGVDARRFCTAQVSRENGISVDCNASMSRYFRRCASALPAVPDAEAVAVHLQDVDVVGEAVQQSSVLTLRAKDVGPFAPGEPGGHWEAAPLVPLAEHLEEQFRPSAVQLDEAQFINDQQDVAGQLPLQVEQRSLVPELPSARGPGRRP